jgi:hypothetical protein
MFHKSNRIQLDASFRAIHPHIYSIPRGMQWNESFSLAIIVGMAENIESYQ